jgi:GNAT superfamily N-acetyltransferase
MEQINNSDIKFYSSSNLPFDIYSQMYCLIINNLFITYPEKLENKELMDNEKNFNTLYNSIMNEPSYKIITYEKSNILYAYLAYSIIDKDLWISEIQIEPDYQGKGILKLLLKEFLSKIDTNMYQDVTISINAKNYKSQEVFKHIGFEMFKPNIYKIKLENLNKWVRKQ